MKEKERKLIENQIKKSGWMIRENLLFNNL